MASLAFYLVWRNVFLPTLALVGASFDHLMPRSILVYNNFIVKQELWIKNKYMAFLTNLWIIVTIRYPSFCSVTISYKVVNNEYHLETQLNTLELVRLTQWRDFFINKKLVWKNLKNLWVLVAIIIVIKS